jgi:streptogramin lyase
MAGFNFEDRLRLALREAAQREQQPGAIARSVAKARRAFQTAGRSFVPAAAAGLATALALVVVAVFLTRAGSDSEAVHPPEVVARLALADSLGVAVGAHGSVWLADTSGDRLLRVDPKSREVIARIPVEDDLAMAPVGEMLWVVSQSSSRTPRLDGAESGSRSGPTVSGRSQPTSACCASTPAPASGSRRPAWTSTRTTANPGPDSCASPARR